MKKHELRAKNLLNRSFVVLLALILVAGLGKTFLKPVDTNYYENRYANKVLPFSFGAYKDSTFQTGMDDALSDQIPLAVRMKRTYNYIDSYFTKLGISTFLKNSDRYISFKGLNLYNEYITYYTRKLEGEKEALSAKAENLNAAFSQYPDVDFYVYYIEKDTDINFETNEKVPLYETLKGELTLPEDHKAAFTVNNFDEFSQNFYKTDHHWNHRGSYKGYTEIMRMLGIEDVLRPVEEVDLGYLFSGSKASTSGAENIFSEPFFAYRFAYPEMDIKINGEAAEDYGKQDAYFSHDPEAISYGAFYGGDEGEIIFDTKREELEDLLVIGESYDNAVLKLIASHYNKTYSLDLRNYKANTGRDFQFSEYLREHKISNVLLVGNIDYFVMDEFMLRG